MNVMSLKWKEIVELVGLVAILSGMYFVYAEIQQSSTIARAELSSANFGRMAELRDKLLDSEFSDLFQKGVQSPSDLTESERNVLRSYFSSLIWVMESEKQYYDLGIFAEYDQMARMVARQYLNRGYGRAYWNVAKNRINADIAAVVNEELARVDSAGGSRDIDLEVLQEIESL